MRGAQYAPLQADGQQQNMQSYPEDQPPEFESSIWLPNQQEMQRSCIKRHAPYYVNVLMMDYSVKRSTIKGIWRLHWGKGWTGNEPLPVWPASGWMDDVPEP